jgi:hypothetical protein
MDTRESIQEKIAIMLSAWLNGTRRDLMTETIPCWMIDVLALDNGRAGDATNIFTVPMLRAVEVVTGELRKCEPTIHTIPRSSLPLVKQRIPGSWNICGNPTISESDSGVVNTVLIALCCLPKS